jgi:hypothetical protein
MSGNVNPSADLIPFTHLIVLTSPDCVNALNDNVRLASLKQTEYVVCTSIFALLCEIASLSERHCVLFVIETTFVVNVCLVDTNMHGCEGFKARFDAFLETSDPHPAFMAALLNWQYVGFTHQEFLVRSGLGYQVVARDLNKYLALATQTYKAVDIT